MQAVLACFQLKQNNERLIDFIGYNTKRVANRLTDTTDEKLLNFVHNTQLLKDEWASSATHTAELFRLAQEQLKSLNRIAEWEPDWIVYPLYMCALQLFKIAEALDRSAEASSQTAKPGDLKQEGYLTQCGRTIHMSLNLCLKDRDPSATNKRYGAYYFALLLFKAYHKLRAHGLITNMVKVLESRSKELPSVQSAFGNRRAFTVTYCYYLGRYYACRKSDYAKGFHWLNMALMDCHTSYKNQQRQILVFLIPIAFLTNRWYPRNHVLNKCDPAKAGIDYRPIKTALLQGNLALLDQQLEHQQLPLLTRDLYLPFSHLRPYVILRLVKLVWKHNHSNWKLPTALIATAIAFASKNSTTTTTAATSSDKSPANDVDADLLDRTECLIANLINKGFVKGYLSHGNRVLVVSKTEPFPRLVRKNAI
ncbi:uncharacterized protein Ecym_4664 [Eremothecium cymbalariae DBVPG|uniref:PCI domain-containing protein n=1 Tax=Eremothecium cymbalariae (strain CBS 270.75 / DBVPG 7215 / KCTC 17166 / NRRL Y-17582) TaxID=931890 RepID=G8JSG3_ERECY|nr:hypothetical protein Ecym_4664 [Eremothecium cymbalariae DBVPG\